MTVLLRCQHAGRTHQIVIRPGQVANVGRNEWMEMCIADDPELHDQHFAIDCRNEPLLTANPSAVVYVAGQPQSQIELRGDLDFVAGCSVFKLSLTSASSSGPQELITTAVKVVATGTSEYFWFDESKLKQCSLSAAALASLAADHNLAPEVAAEHLLERSLQLDAIRLLAQLLPHHTAIHWAHQCVSANPGWSANSDQPYRDFSSWLLEPTEPHRAACQKVLMTRSMQDSIDWLLQAIAWTGGSLAPADSPVVVPPEYLPAIAVATALQLDAATRADIASALTNFVQLAIDQFKDQMQRELQ